MRRQVYAMGMNNKPLPTKIHRHLAVTALNYIGYDIWHGQCYTAANAYDRAVSVATMSGLITTDQATELHTPGNIDRDLAIEWVMNQ